MKNHRKSVCRTEVIHSNMLAEKYGIFEQFSGNEIQQRQLSVQIQCKLKLFALNFLHYKKKDCR